MTYSIVVERDEARLRQNLRNEVSLRVATITGVKYSRLAYFKSDLEPWSADFQGVSLC